MLDEITPLILTKDEEANIGRTLAQLGWAGEIVIVDSGSIVTDSAGACMARGSKNQPSRKNAGKMSM